MKETYSRYGRSDWEMPHRGKVEKTKRVTKENLYEKLSSIFSENEKYRALSQLKETKW